MKPGVYEEYIYISRYARYLPEQGRRENWGETVDRYFDFFQEHLARHHGYKPPKTLVSELRSAVFELEVMPSMRALMTAGKALERENMAGYNCSYVEVRDLKAFAETMYILMCGTGVGYSVERQIIKDLPECVPLTKSHQIIIVGDSKRGWSEAFLELLICLFSGNIPKIDYSEVRPAGAPLKTFGGRASGPEPLRQLFEFVIQIVQNAAGRRFTSLECHDIMTKIGDIVVVGGVRRSAMISLSNLSDMRMQKAKHGEFWKQHPHRALANNSTAYTEKPEVGIFMDEFKSLYESKSGERGIFNREAVIRQCREIGRDPNHEWGTNPCGEINLRPFQLCNLSEAVLRENDFTTQIIEKVKLASILGTWQSTLTFFNFIRDEWKKNTEEERLLGVSLTGIYSHPLLGKVSEKASDLLQELREEVKETNVREASAIGINYSTARTCVKPSGTVSQRVRASSGIHPWWNNFFIRTVRGDIKDPLAAFMKDQGVPCEPCINNPTSTVVFSFPQAAPKGAVCRNDVGAIKQLELWLQYKKNWTDHNPSCTIYVREEEWLDVQAWVWKNWNDIGGLTFLPHSDFVYKQAPYQDITEEEYNERMSKLPSQIDWSRLSEYEKGLDYTTGNQELACAGGVCEVVDIGGKAPQPA